MGLEKELNATRTKVVKEWGFEDWLINDEKRNLCGKRLILYRQCHCSMHYHRIKSELFYINNGLVLIEYDGTVGLMKPGDTLFIEPFKKHRFTGLTGAEIIESSTFHRDEDSYRESISGKWPEQEFAQLIAPYKEEIERFYLLMPTK